MARPRSNPPERLVHLSRHVGPAQAHVGQVAVVESGQAMTLARPLLPGEKGIEEADEPLLGPGPQAGRTFASGPGDEAESEIFTAMLGCTGHGSVLRGYRDDEEDCTPPPTLSTRYLRLGAAADKRGCL